MYLFATALALSNLYGTQPAYPPPGYEIVDVLSMEIQMGVPSMNDCGQIVFTVSQNEYDTNDIIKYDNGMIIQITNNTVREALPRINNTEAITWTEGDDIGFCVGTIVLYENDALTYIADGTISDINDSGDIVYESCISQGCECKMEIVFYDGADLAPLTNEGYWNFTPRINNDGDAVWTQYDFDSSPATAVVMLWSGGKLIELTEPENNARAPSINSVGQVVWNNDDGFDLWKDGDVEQITDWGFASAINDFGQIHFARWHDEIPAWQTWLYWNGDFYRLSEDQYWNIQGDINNYGEVVWEWFDNFDLQPSGVRMLRRIRNGDVDFDDDVDLADHHALPGCMTGPGDFDRLCDCRFYDMGHDRDVDLADFALFQNAFGVPIVWPEPPHNCCDTDHGPGCSNPEIESCVCEAAPVCCDSDWDDYCVFILDALSCGDCP